MFNPVATFVARLVRPGWNLFLPEVYWRIHRDGHLPYWGLVQYGGSTSRGDHQIRTSWQVRQFMQETLGIPVLQPEPARTKEEQFNIDIGGWQDIESAGDPIQLPEPTFTDVEVWLQTLKELKLSEGYASLTAVTGAVYNVSFVRITLGCCWDSKESRAATMKMIRKTYGVHIQEPDARNIRGYFVLCRRRYSEEEITRTRRRIEDQLRKDDCNVICVAKLLKLK